VLIWSRALRHLRRHTLPVALVSITSVGALLFAQGQPAGTYLQKTRTFYSATDFNRLTASKVRVTRDANSELELRIRRLPVHLPFSQFTVIAVESPSVTWIGSAQGAARVHTTDRHVEYFAGQRWLPDDDVTGFGFEESATWVETPKGFARIEYKPMTLEEKSRHFVDQIQKRHNRWGLTATSELRVTGDLSTNRTVSSDNDGLWTAIYVAAECFRYKVTGEPDARENARRGMQAILRLESITGIPGFPARSFIKVGDDVQPSDGEWHDTPDKGWRWKGDTSSDEIVGHYFVYPIYYDLVADESEKVVLRAALDRITNHILDHNYQLIDVDGQHTRWGWWAPELIWREPDETGLRALHMLAHLRVAMHLAGNTPSAAKYRAAYEDLIKAHKYHLLTRNQKIAIPGHINHSDDELAFLSYYPLLQYETNAELLAVYRQSLERSWQIERPERNPLWNIIYAVGTGAQEFDRAESLRTLREIPLDTIMWTVKNSGRLDVPIDPLNDRFNHNQSLIVLPYDEIPVWKWNANPYNLDGGSGGRSEDDGAYFLLPYWMGRYHRLVN
jgi:hypothetical protein